MKKTSYLARGAIIAACYAASTLALPVAGFGPVQLRVSEALCVLPFFMPEAVWGLSIGCVVANLAGVFLGVTMPWDVVIGPLATFIAAVISARIKLKWLVPLPAVISNALFVGVMLTYVVIPGAEAGPIWFNILTVGAGELLACYALGMPLLAIIEKVYGRNSK